MKRRAFLSALSGGLLAAPLAGEGQQAASLPRIGFLAPASLSDPRVPPYIRAFQESGQSRQRIAGATGAGCGPDTRGPASTLVGTGPQ